VNLSSIKESKPKIKLPNIDSLLFLAFDSLKTAYMDSTGVTSAQFDSILFRMADSLGLPLDTTFIGARFDQAPVIQSKDKISVLDVLVMLSIYPSPFSESFSLQFTIAADARVTVELCNALGQTIRTCCDNTSYSTGSHTLNIDGRGLAGGTYFAMILIEGAVVKTVPVMKIDQ
jgi:hypothetical protein